MNIMKSQANTAIVSKYKLTTYKMKHTVTSQQSTYYVIICIMTSQHTVYVLVLLVVRHLWPALAAAVVEATEAATAAAATRYQAAEYSQELWREKY